MSCPGGKRRREFTRRELLGAGLAAATTAALVPVIGRAETSGQGTGIPRVPGPGRVVQVRKPGMRVGLYPDPKAAREMVDRAVMELSGESDPGRAWLRFVSPTDRVGLKVNCLGTRVSSSTTEVVFAVADAIREAGVPDANILVLDMYGSNMMGGRYVASSNPGKMRVLAHRDEGGYRKGWVSAGPARVRFAELFLWTTAVINIPVLKDHDLAGVTCCMKNMTFGTVEKPHVNHESIGETIPRLWALEEIRSRVRLNLVDGSFLLYDGGPKHNPRAHKTHDAIYATLDPVAMDAVAHELIAEARAAAGLESLAAVGRPATYIERAAELGLGVADRASIRLETIDLPPLAGPA